MKIFLVEDDPFCSAMYENHLQNLGYKSITCFSDGSALLKNLHKKPDLIFLDYNLEDFKGLTLLTKIKEYNPSIYVVIISGQSNMDTTIQLLKKGAFDYIIKDDNDLESISNSISRFHSAKEFNDSLSNNSSYLNNEKQINLIIEAQEKVRKEISTELHDNVNQLLSVSKLYIDSAYKNEASRMPLLLEAKTIINSAIGEVRKLSHSFQSAMREDFNLLDQVNNLIRMLKDSNKLMVISEIDIENPDNILSKKTQYNLLRILQELTNNMLKYSNAKMTFIGLCYRNQEVHLTYGDDGVGFELENTKKGLGITNIFDRLTLIGGVYAIDTGINKGCKWNIRLPILKSKEVMKMDN